MIKFENIEVSGFDVAIRGMRNPMNSWSKSDSYDGSFIDKSYLGYVIGENDLKLMRSLAKSGSDHSKFARMIIVTMDIIAPFYWWKEFDTYKVGTVANSCSTMHKITSKEFTLDDFSCEHLYSPIEDLLPIINMLNTYRELYLETKDKSDWWQIIQLLPSSYNQRRTVQMNYEVLHNMNRIGRRRDHKLDEWVTFCMMVDKLPYYNEIFGD